MQFALAGGYALEVCEEMGIVVVSSSKSARASRRLIESDLRFSMAVLRATSSKRLSAEARSFLLLSHIHHLALVAYETRSFMGREAASSTRVEQWSYDLALAGSRHSTKLFNDKQKTQLELLAEFSSGAVRDRNWLLQNNRAPWLFRAITKLGVLVNDTSVAFYGEKILCTSHSISFHAGLDPSAKQDETTERARELAAYISELSSATGVDGYDDDYSREWHSELVLLKDARYAKLYPAMFPGLPLAESIALSILQTNLVSLQLMREFVHIADPLAPATFKLRFAGVWQMIETLRVIGADHSDLVLPGPIRRGIEALLRDAQTELMRSKGARSLRNVLVHYGLGSIDASDMKWDDPMLGLPELLVNGASWLTLDQILDEQIAALLDMFAAWAGPFAHTLAEPHE